MRDAYHEDLDEIGTHLCEMARYAGGMIDDATRALLTADLALAEEVISADDKLDALFGDVEQQAFDLLARQQPVASDLRILITSLRMVADLERMGDLALHVAKVARLRYPAAAVPDEARATIAEMGRVARGMVDKAGRVIASRDVAVARQLESDDDAMDDLLSGLFRMMLGGEWQHGVETAIDVTLCGRYYERFADHAVSIGRRVLYLVTGERTFAGDPV